MKLPESELRVFALRLLESVGDESREGSRSAERVLKRACGRRPRA
ncbi:uncharacterized protein SOCE836_026240 [Sorangium cellulosum]|uniref:Uncharacterized protein n=1 Tax=Sorangium cellulosum TaxID=56 RepID=A0A4P2QL48_SORCE|nr:uncharacterized protein SOCE836_026240 [Sorangium cellulosum]